jgi:transcriptional regulator with XRE-family HTH domain
VTTTDARAPSVSVPSSADVRRTELAAFLRACRARIGPEAVGLPPGPRRRTPGLRREEVAQLAGVGVTWYTWLEQGRRINASEQVIEAIARTLKLDIPERDHLFRLAEINPVQTPSAACLPAEVQVILDALDPLPASVINTRFDLLAWNEAYGAFFTKVVGRSGRANSLWCAFTQPSCCNPFVNRKTLLPRMVAMLRAEYGKHVGEPQWESFLGELRRASPEFVELWALQQVAGPDAVEKVYRHPAVGEIRMVTTGMYLAAVPDTRMLVYTPGDDVSADRVAWLRANPSAHNAFHDHG